MPKQQQKQQQPVARTMALSRTENPTNHDWILVEQQIKFAAFGVRITMTNSCVCVPTRKVYGILSQILTLCKNNKKNNNVSLGVGQTPWRADCSVATGATLCAIARPRVNFLERVFYRGTLIEVLMSNKTTVIRGSALDNNVEPLIIPA